MLTAWMLAATAVAISPAQQDLLDRTNAYRNRCGLSSLGTYDGINATAQRWAEQMAARRSMYHSGFSMGGENVAWNSSGVARGIQQWINSSGHRSNMLGGWRYVGVGVAWNGGSCYVCQQFSNSTNVPADLALNGVSRSYIRRVGSAPRRRGLLRIFRRRRR